ncbi:hypothetical protein BDK92_0087 [Micromonospora pisi]|uniref:Uncharacterized protein n=1 Tax=Micromonospora pisi TaxID=589240 RepID=A0A495JA22_9ACTN|nr:hypothetical protein [Micromonospora pisi]RKR85876.1 hypothetical protein BDK92_0087 [Micromonospora pisi]
MYFVERSRVDSPLSKMVFHVPDTTVLGWFQHAWHHEDPEALLDAEIGGGSYGLDSIFEAIEEHHLPCPQTLDELRELLGEHLWIESDDPIRLDERGLRVRTNDDEVDLAYFFLEDEAVTAHPDRLMYLVNHTWPLPSSAGAPSATFTPDVALRVVNPPGSGPNSVYAVRISWQHTDHNGTNLDQRGAIVFPGVSLPGLSDHLRRIGDSVSRECFDADLLRSLVGPGDDSIGPAINRYIALESYDLSIFGEWTAPSHEQILQWKLPEPPLKARVAVDEHLAQAARYIDDFFGYEQLFLFDTQWAAAHPDLALSLLRYAAHWDPFAS